MVTMIYNDTIVLMATDGSFVSDMILIIPELHLPGCTCWATRSTVACHSFVEVQRMSLIELTNQCVLAAELEPAATQQMAELLHKLSLHLLPG